MMSNTPSQRVRFTSSWNTSIACYHAEHITERDHGIRHAEGEMLDDVEPQDCACTIKQTAKSELPISEEVAPELPIPPERQHALQGKLQENLSSCQQKALYDC